MVPALTAVRSHSLGFSALEVHPVKQTSRKLWPSVPPVYERGEHVGRTRVDEGDVLLRNRTLTQLLVEAGAAQGDGVGVRGEGESGGSGEEVLGRVSFMR